MKAGGQSWVPAALAAAAGELRRQASPVSRVRFDRMLSDARLAPVFRRLAPAMDRLRWRKFLQLCDQAAEVSNLTKEIREARTALSKVARRVARTLAECVELCEERERLAAAAHVRCVALPEISRLARLSAMIKPEPVSDLVEAAVSSRKGKCRHLSLSAFARCWDLRWQHGQVATGDLAAIAIVALGIPAAYAGFSEAEMESQAYEAIRTARRHRARTGGDSRIKNEHESPIETFTGGAQDGTVVSRPTLGVPT